MLTITLNEQELAAFQQLIDMTLRASGIQALDLCTYFKSKIADAAAAQKAAAQSALDDLPKPNPDVKIAVPAASEIGTEAQPKRSRAKAAA